MIEIKNAMKCRSFNFICNEIQLKRQCHVSSTSDVFSQFLQEDVDAKAMATRAVHGLAISEQLAKLAEGINLLNHEIHSQVKSRGNYCDSIAIVSYNYCDL